MRKGVYRCAVIYLKITISKRRKLSNGEHASREHTPFHPSGDPTPSKEDIELTEQWIAAGNLLEIELMDHLIIGHQRFISLKEQLRW